MAVAVARRHKAGSTSPSAEAGASDELPEPALWGRASPSSFKVAGKVTQPASNEHGFLSTCLFTHTLFFSLIVSK